MPALAQAAYHKLYGAALESYDVEAFRHRAGVPPRFFLSKSAISPYRIFTARLYFDYACANRRFSSPATRGTLLIRFSSKDESRPSCLIAPKRRATSNEKRDEF